MASMIASRWWTDTEIASHVVPPAVARWRRVRLHGDLSPRFVDLMEGLQRQGLLLELEIMGQ
jgi:hypothetical protein